jgi:hypothetical protein
MSATLIIRDQEMGQSQVEERELVVPSERMTVRELIRERVYQEVKDRNAGKAFKGKMLVTPGSHEARLNEPAIAKQIDWRKQFETACDAFDSNRILVLIGDRQADSLDDQFDVSSQTTVMFIRLQLLVGG